MGQGLQNPWRADAAYPVFVLSFSHNFIFVVESDEFPDLLSFRFFQFPPFMVLDRQMSGPLNIKLSGQLAIF